MIHLVHFHRGNIRDNIDQIDCINSLEKPTKYILNVILMDLGAIKILESKLCLTKPLAYS